MAGTEHLVVGVLDDEPETPAGPGEESRSSRDDLLRRAAIAGGTVLTGGVLSAGLPRLAASAPSPAQDVQILNLALLLEYLQAAFYRESSQRAFVGGELRRFVDVVAGHEQEHVDFLRDALGGDAREEPRFDFGESTRSDRSVAATSVDLEDLAVSAYNGQAPNLTPDALAAAAEIVSVHARHAAWIRSITGRTPAIQATDQPRTQAQVEAALEATGFLRPS
jgi:rubrerythrin